MIPRVPGGATRAPFAILPLGAASETRVLLAARGVRAVGDGFVSLLLPVYLLALGYAHTHLMSFGVPISTGRRFVAHRPSPR